MLRIIFQMNAYKILILNKLPEVFKNGRLIGLLAY
jgi:hypothetical protein